MEGTTLSFLPYQASYSSTLPAKVEKGDLSPDFVIAAEDIEGEFMTVKDSVQKNTFALKILGEGVATKSTPTNDQLNQISICQVSHLRYLQDEYATLVVKSRFDPTYFAVFWIIAARNS